MLAQGQIQQIESMVVDLEDLIFAWQNFLQSTPWSMLIADRVPKQSGCGLIYELPNFLNRSNESFAIADMRHISYAEPHYHPTGETEIYFVLQGTALVVVGGKELHVAPGDVVIIQPNNVHFTIPDDNFVIAAVNTPPFRPESYIVITDTDRALGFDFEQFKKMILKN